MPSQPELIDKIRDILAAGQLLPADAGVLVAVSGGPDSMALLDLLRHIHPGPIRVAHLNHGLRPGECDQDEALVRAYCLEHAIPLEVASPSVADLAKADSTSHEVAGRKARYAFFTACRKAWLLEPGSPRDIRIALAHHLDDQAETLLLHLGRGCGLDGLSGMKPVSGALIRPLLGIRRSDLLQYVEENKVPWRLDASNQELITLRNRLRHQILPAWAEALGYDPAMVLARSADLVREDQALLDALAEAAWQRAVLEMPGPGVTQSLEIFRMESPAIQNRMLRKAWHASSGTTRDIEWRHLKLARDFLNDESRSRGHLDWPFQVDLDLDRKAVRFLRNTPE